VIFPSYRAAERLEWYGSAVTGTDELRCLCRVVSFSAERWAKTCFAVCAGWLFMSEIEKQNEKVVILTNIGTEGF
jgi:hypothetical protein